jgi:hypothetical protein
MNGWIPMESPMMGNNDDDGDDEDDEDGDDGDDADNDDADNDDDDADAMRGSYLSDLSGSLSYSFPPPPHTHTPLVRIAWVCIIILIVPGFDHGGSCRYCLSALPLTVPSRPFGKNYFSAS